MALTTARWRRTGMLLALPARAAGRSVWARAAGRVRGGTEHRRNVARRRTADDTGRVLGDLKGGALKVGQLLSTVDALFPPDPDGSWQRALSGMQQDNPGMDLRDVEPVLVAAWGPDWGANFTEFDPHPVAAASIGQVHRARWSDGREVAVKVQYPGIAESMAADMRSLAASLRLTALVARGVAMPPLVAELRARLAEELDYRREADHQHRFAAAYRDHPDVLVPDVVAAADGVLVTDWVTGTRLTEVSQRGSAEQRNRAGQIYQRFFLEAPGKVGLLHTDPHPGNFSVDEQGRLVVVDFGSVLRTPGGLPDTFGRLVAAMLSEDPDEVLARLRTGGFVRPGVDLDVSKLIDYLGPFTEPARHEVFHFSRQWLRGQFGRVNDPRNPDFAVALKLTLPAEQLFTHRVWLGLVGVLSGLNATVSVRSELELYLPGFAGAPDAGAA